MNKALSCFLTVIVVPLLAFGFIPLLIAESPYLLHIFIMVFFYSIFALSWGLLAFSGQISLGHSAFLGLGSYTVAILSRLGFQLPIAAVFAPFVAMFVGFLIGVVCIRLRGWFLALATLAFPIILDPIFGSWALAGRRGGIAVPSFFPPTEYFYIHQYYLFLTLFLVTLLSFHVVLRESRLGVAFSAIRQNELEAELSGIDVVKYKLICFIISSFYAGLAGAFLSQYLGRIAPTIFGFDYSLMPALMTIVGGLHSLVGPVLGALIIVTLNEGLKILPLYGLHVIRLVVVGIILVAFVLFAPKGLIPLIFNQLLKLKQYKTPVRLRESVFTLSKRRKK